MSDWRFTTGELAALETDQEAHMMDTCTIGVYHAVPDGYGIPTATYQAGAPVICGLNWTLDLMSASLSSIRPPRTLKHTAGPSPGL